jgi:predicted kinase
MCGLPFAGKTTLAKKIADHTNSQLIGFDTTWQEIKSKLDPNMDKVGEWKVVLKTAQDKIKKYLNELKSVVYDDINVRVEHREAFRKIAQECGATSIVIYVNTPLEVLREREQNNILNPQRHDVEPINFNNALAQWQEPTLDENVVEYSQSTGISKWLHKL